MKTISTVVRFFSECSIAYLIAGIALTVPSAASGQEPSKIGVLNFREVALESKAGKAAKARLDKLAEKLKKEMKTEQTKLLARRKDLEAAAPRSRLQNSRPVPPRWSKAKQSCNGSSKIRLRN